MTLNAWGLILNSVGAIILFFVGFPPNEYTKEGLWKKSNSVVIPTKHGKVKYSLSYLGIGLLFAGFALQLASEIWR